MSTPILATKLYIPPPRPKAILRPHLIARLNEGLHRKLTLISAPAGFGKTTLVSTWIYDSQFTIYDSPTEVATLSKIENQKSKIVNRVAWLSLDEGDNDPARFLAYLVASLQTIAPNFGKGVLGGLASPQPPPPEAILTSLINEIAAIPKNLLLVLDDYHVIEAKPIDQSLTFLLDHLPPQMHMVIATREDPQLPLARLRARDQLTELRIADLRFSRAEATGFLNQGMGLNLSADAIAALETRTEGWVAGLQLAAISLQGRQDASNFIDSFTGSHHFVMDYLVEEVLQQQPEDVQRFLLHTAILDRLCAPLCDALLLDAAGSGQATLAYLQQANLFIIPLDDERRWFRYHHLFADLLRQRLYSTAEMTRVAEHHLRASRWYEENGLEIEAFRHAVAANDVDLAARLVEGKEMPIHFRGAALAVLNWLKSLPKPVLDARPILYTAYASVLLVTGQVMSVEEKVQAAESALAGGALAQAPEETRQDLIGRIAAIRATVAAAQGQVEAIIQQSRRAIEYLHPQNLAFRTSTMWKLGYAYHLQGNRSAASQSYREVIATGKATGNVIFTLMATIGLGHLQELDNQLPLAAQTHRSVLQVLDEQPLPFASEPHFGLARIHYEWNDLATAQQHIQAGSQLLRQVHGHDRVIAGEVLLARLLLAQGDVVGAATILARASQATQQHNYKQPLPEVVSAQVLTLLHQGKVSYAAELAQRHNLPLCQARVNLAQGNPAAAVAQLAAWREQVEAKGWADERLKVLVIEAVALQALGSQAQAMQRLGEALTLAEPGGFVRLFVDEGRAMAALLSEALTHGVAPEYAGRLLASFPSSVTTVPSQSQIRNPKSAMVEPLSEREVEVLQLIAQGLSNEEIGQRLSVALSTVKGHNLRIFGKLQVQRRTEAVARARELGVI